MYSNFKHHVTYKELQGIAASGAIAFISELYEGSISEKKIVRISGIRIRNLLDHNDSIMVDMTVALQLK